MKHRVSVRVAGLQPAQILTGLVAVAFIAFGVLGFIRTGVGDFAGDQHAFVLGFAVNPLHNIVHLAIGVLGLLMMTGSGLSRMYGWILFIGYGAVFVWGLMLAGVLTVNPIETIGNPLALNTSDNWLHLGVAVLGLLIAVLPARRKVIEEEPELESEPEPSHEAPEPRIEQMDPTVSTRPKDEAPAPGPVKDESARTIKS